MAIDTAILTEEDTGRRVTLTHAGGFKEHGLIHQWDEDAVYVVLARHNARKSDEGIAVAVNPEHLDFS